MRMHAAAAVALLVLSDSQATASIIPGAFKQGRSGDAEVSARWLAANSTGNVGTPEPGPFDVPMDAQLAVTVGVLALLSALCRTLVGIGAAVVFTVGWSVAAEAGVGTGALTSAVAFMFMQDLIVSPVQAVYLRKEASPKFIAVVVVLWISSELLGTQLLVANDNIWLRRSLGITLLVVFVYQVKKDFGMSISCLRRTFAPSGVAGESPMRAPPGGDQRFELEGRKNWMWTLLMGVGGGLLKGLFGIPLPVLLIFTLGTRIPKNQWRACNAAIQFLTMPTKGYFFFVAKEQWDMSQLQLYIVAAVASMCAIPVGNWLSKRINQQEFRQMLMVVLFFGALLMATASTGVEVFFSVLGLMAVSLVAFVGHRLKKRCGKHPPVPEAKPETEEVPVAEDKGPPTSA